MRGHEEVVMRGHEEVAMRGHEEVVTLGQCACAIVEIEVLFRFVPVSGELSHMFLAVTFSREACVH